MVEVASIVAFGLVAAVAVTLYVLAWRATRNLSFVGKLAARLALTAILLAPVVMAMLAGEFMEVRSPAPTSGSAPPPPAAMPEEEHAREGETARPPTAEPAKPAEGEPGPSRGLGGPAMPSMPSMPSAPSAPPPVPVEVTQWDVVPVFYGTDRATAASAPRLSYGDGRGRRLELGRALVTVPKSHTVPRIERPWAIHVPYIDVTLYEESEDPREHFTMQELKALSRQDFLALVRERLAASSRFKKQALIFIHGYNTTFDYAIYRTAQITNDLKFDGVPFAYSWPSGGGLASYTYDRESSGQSEPFLREFMNMVIHETGAEAVSVVAHSMGNQPVLQVLKDLKAAKPHNVVLSQIILAAPDVDRDNFENIAREIQGLAKGITLYAAANDRALGISKGVNGGVPRAGDIPAGGPLILPGVDTIDVTAVSTDSLGLNHSGYAENNELLGDMQALIETGMRPPNRRTPGLEVVESAKGTYWRYPRAAP